MIAELIILCNRIFRRAGRRPILIRFIRAPFLVDLLHFRDDPLLRNCIILNPHWATGAVYLILFDNAVIEAGGEFDAKDIKRL